MSDYARQIRLDLENLRYLVERIQIPQTTTPEAVLVKTATKDTYPTTANAWYYCEIQRVNGNPTEGSAGTVVGVGRNIFAYNVGPAIPDVGTLLIASLSRGSYSINFCQGGS